MLFSGANVLLPIGHLLGESAGGAGEFDLRIGGELHRVSTPALNVWAMCHFARPSTTLPMDRGLLGSFESVFASLGVVDPWGELERLLDRGLVIELSLADAAVVDVFARTVRLVPIQTFTGNTPDALDKYVVGFPHRSHSVVDAVVADVLVWGPTYRDLASVCDEVPGWLPEECARLGLSSGLDVVMHVLRSVGPVLWEHSAFFDAAGDLELVREVDPAVVPVDPDDRRELGTYALGFEAGGRCTSERLDHALVRLGSREVHLPDRGQWVTWQSAFGVQDESGEFTDDEAAIFEHARRNGAWRPERDIRDASGAGAVLGVPDGGAQLVEFAAGYRFVPLMAYMGRAVDGRPALGGRDDEAFAALSDEEYAVWRDAPVRASLLDAAGAVGAVGSVDELRAFLRLVQIVCFKGAGFIDECADIADMRGGSL